MRRRFVMLDRDGTLIRERHYLSDPEAVELLPGALEGLQTLRDKGLGLIVVTNQSGLGRGFFDLETLNKIHERLTGMLMLEGVMLDGIYFCPHLPEDNCGCRKPATGMALRAADELDFDLTESYMVGDKAIDMQFGKAIGATTFLVLTGYGKRDRGLSSSHADYVVEGLSKVAELIPQAMR